jgi:integrase
LCSALTNAVTEELIAKNVAALAHVSKPRKRKVKPWTAFEARQFLESARRDHDPLYAPYVLILVLGLRKGEVIGLTWHCIDLDRAELDTSWQLQRVAGQLLHRQTKTEASDATLPLPEICVTALRMRAKDQAEASTVADDQWVNAGLVFTTRAGTPIEPRNFNRRFERRCAKAGVRRITVHDVRHTCATLLAALDIHPRVAMRILRHAQIDVTMNVYTEVSDAKTLQALKRLGKQLGS